MEFINLHTLIISAKFFKELGEKIKSEKNPCLNSWTTPTAPKHKKTCTNPCDSGQWNSY
jgi:hypothetical protein